MKIKVCGMREPENIEAVAALLPDFMGFIFYEKSKRYVEGTAMVEVLNNLPVSIKKVGVFVNATTQEIADKISTYSLDVIQLHGRENPRQCHEIKGLGVEVIKVFSVNDSFRFENVLLYENCADYFLFDTRGDLPGGNGYPFDWELLKQNISPKPYFLSGGLNPANIGQLKELHPKPFALDVNSGFELEPGLKNVETLKQLFQQVKEY